MLTTVKETKTLPTFGVFRANQNDHDIFVGDVPAQELIKKNVVVNVWIPTFGGYQRIRNDPKVDRIAKFLSVAKGALPSSVLLCVREKIVKFVATKGNRFYGYLKIPDKSKIYVVDGQHRIEGLRYAINDMGISDLKRFHVPVVFICPSLWNSKLDPQIEEGKQFITINKTQTGVKGDLVDTFLLALDSVEKLKKKEAMSGLPEEIVREMSSRIRALTVVLILNRLPPFEDLIRRPNQVSRERFVGQKQFTDTLVAYIANQKRYKNLLTGKLAVECHN